LIRPRTEQLSIWLAGYKDLAELAAVHEAMGKTTIGYHFVIDQDAKLHVGRGMSERGSVDPESDAYAIQVCYLGMALVGQEQMLLLRALVRAVTLLYPDLKVKYANCKEPTTWPSLDPDTQPSDPETQKTTPMQLLPQTQEVGTRKVKKPPLAQDVEVD